LNGGFKRENVWRNLEIRKAGTQEFLSPVSAAGHSACEICGIMPLTNHDPVRQQSHRSLPQCGTGAIAGRLTKHAKRLDCGG
jgi:ribosomal protein S27AE